MQRCRRQVVVEAPAHDVYVATPPAYEVYSYRARASPPVHYEAPRYYYRHVDEDDVVDVRPRYRAVCGDSQRWNGNRCVYIRH